MNRKSCLLCQYSKFKMVSPKVRDSVKHKVIKCKKCGHVQIHPVPNLEDEKKFYDENLQDKNIKFYGKIRENRKKSLNDTVRRIELIKKLIPKKDKILEIGSGHGFFLESMEKEGYDITGIEVSKEKRGLSKKITNARILPINIVEEMPNLPKFRAIVMFHVLEHIIDPVNFLKKIRALIKPHGLLVIEVPNFDDYQIEFNKEYREFYWQRAHIHYFTPFILRKILTKAGFQVQIKGVQRYGIENMFNWKLNKKPQIEIPSYNLPKHLNWLEKYYKTELERTLKCDTIMVVATSK